MIFIVLTDVGIETRPIIAPDLASAADQIRLRHGAGIDGDGVTPVNVAVLLPHAIGKITPNPDPTLATFASTGDGATQQTIRNAARNALATNQAFLDLANPTAAQNAAQIKALTRQVDGLIRLQVGDFSGTT